MDKSTSKELKSVDDNDYIVMFSKTKGVNQAFKIKKSEFESLLNIASLSDYLPLAGGTMTGNIVMSGASILESPSILNLRAFDTDGNIYLSTDGETFMESYLYFDPTSAAVNFGSAGLLASAQSVELKTAANDTVLQVIDVSGVFNVIFNKDLPTYANDGAADADANLTSKALYKITGDRTVYQKP